MASAKDTFEANTFEARSFASGTFYGVGPAGGSGGFPFLRSRRSKREQEDRRAEEDQMTALALALVFDT